MELLVYVGRYTEHIIRLVTYDAWKKKNPSKTLSSDQLEIRPVERGICPIATLYSLAAAYKGG